VAKRFIAYLCAHPGAVPSGARIDVIRCLNPDGRVHDTRGNARHVDLNRNLPTRDWKCALDARDETRQPRPEAAAAPPGLSRRPRRCSRTSSAAFARS